MTKMTNEEFAALKPSALLRVAVADAISIEKGDVPGVELDPFIWHKAISSESKCLVCLAGAAMTCTLGVPRHQYRDPEDFEEGVCNQLFLLDCLRCADVNNFYTYANPDYRFVNYDDLEIALMVIKHSCESSGSGFADWQVYLDAAHNLEILGL